MSPLMCTSRAHCCLETTAAKGGSFKSFDGSIPTHTHLQDAILSLSRMHPDKVMPAEGEDPTTSTPQGTSDGRRHLDEDSDRASSQEAHPHAGTESRKNDINPGQVCR